MNLFSAFLHKELESAGCWCSYISLLLKESDSESDTTGSYCFKRTKKVCRVIIMCKT